MVTANNHFLDSVSDSAPKKLKLLAIFASGAGSNANRLLHYFKAHPSIQVSLIVCNLPTAGVLSVADEHKTPYLLIEKERFFRGDAYLEVLKAHSIDFIVLAGFLWKIPAILIQQFPNAIVNIHPSLLPKYGGKGMYGSRVHQAVLDHQEEESGITIHYVNERFDEGETILQANCPVLPTDDAASLAARIHELEYEHFAPTIERIIAPHGAV